MYSEISGVSKHKLGGRRDKLKFQAICMIRDKCIMACEQQVLISTRKCDLLKKFDIEGRDAG